MTTEKLVSAHSANNGSGGGRVDTPGADQTGFEESVKLLQLRNLKKQYAISIRTGE